jgi:hypothetical protein
MMMTAILTFFGLSTCATLFIVTALALKARVQVINGDASGYDAEYAPEERAASNVVPAFGH